MEKGTRISKNWFAVWAKAKLYIWYSSKIMLENELNGVSLIHHKTTKTHTFKAQLNWVYAIFHEETTELFVLQPRYVFVCCPFLFLCVFKRSKTCASIKKNHSGYYESTLCLIHYKKCIIGLKNFILLPLEPWKQKKNVLNYKNRITPK